MTTRSHPKFLFFPSLLILLTMLLTLFELNLIHPLRQPPSLASANAALRKEAIIANGLSAERHCKYYFSVYAIFQNEGRFLKEWIEYYKMMGAEHFYLFNNESTDNYLEVLQPYIQSGEVELFNWSPPAEAWNFGQVEAIAGALRYSTGKTRWLASIDIDEFIVPNGDWDNITDFLRVHEDYHQIFMRWHHFGTSNVDRIPDDKLVIETLNRSQKHAPTAYMRGKVIVKPHAVQTIRITEPILYSCYKSLDLNPNNRSEHPPLRINHYWTRDIEYLINVKKPHREVWEGRVWTDAILNDWIHAYNDQLDHSMDRFIAELRWRVFGTN